MNSKIAPMPDDWTGLEQGARNYKAFQDGLKDAKRQRELDNLKLAAVALGAVGYLRYRNAKKAGK